VVDWSISWSGIPYIKIEFALVLTMTIAPADLITTASARIAQCSD
jgi:hypothetical protein